MDILKIIILSLSSLTVLFIITKLLGNREMAQLTMFDYINSITIGSIAAEMSTSLKDDFIEPLVAMITYGTAIFLVSIITTKSIKLRRIISGKSLILYDNGYLYKENFKKTKLDVSEFLTECRKNGYFNIADIQTALIESNGKLSILPKSLKRPVTPEDLNLTPSQEQLVSNVIIDGNIIPNNLKATGNNEKWIENELKKQKIKDIKDVFLATCDSDNNLSVYVNTEKKMVHDTFE